MGCGRWVVVNVIQENVDVIGDAVLAFLRNDAENLAGLLRDLLAHPSWVGKLGDTARERVRNHYDWETITRQCEDLFVEVSGRRLHAR